MFLRSLDIPQAQRAIDAGAAVYKLRVGFYSGGHNYNHLVIKQNVAIFRVSDCVFKSLVIPNSVVIQTID